MMQLFLELFSVLSLGLWWFEGPGERFSVGSFGVGLSFYTDGGKEHN